MQPKDYNQLTPKQRKELREEYIRHQQGLCHYCGEPLSDPYVTTKYINKRWFPEKFFDWPVHLHHDHDTGMTIGAVHCVCNALLWQYHGK